MPLSSTAPAPAPLEDDEDLDEAVERSLADDLKDLVGDGRSLLGAEIAYQKARAVFAAASFKMIALFGAVATVLAVMALMGLTVGLIIALTPHLTAWGATALVVLGLLLAAFLLVKSAASRWNKTIAALSDEGTRL